MIRKKHDIRPTTEARIPRSRVAWIAIGAAALIGGCATTPDRNGSIEEARSAVAAARNDPKIAGAGAVHVQKAEKDLAKAERIWKDRGTRASEHVDHYSYLARRHAEIATRQAEVEAAEATVRDAETNRQKALLDARERQAAASMAEAESMSREADLANQRAETAEQRASDLQDEIGQLKEMGAKKTDRGLVLTLGDDILFDFGKATVKPGADRRLDDLAGILNRYPSYKLAIEGHTDSIGSDDANQRLSERRADAVREILVSHGVDSGRITSRGMGEAYPIASNETNAGRQNNRRVEIIIAGEEGMAVR